MSLKITNLAINHGTNPLRAQVGLSDKDGCNVFVNVELTGKPLEEFTLRELSDLAHEAAKHLIGPA